MRELMLKDDILLSVEHPERYIGGEVGSVMKDREKVKIRYALCFPDVYEIGMSHLGIQILYSMFNAEEDVWCERVYSPWTDLDRLMRQKGIPLFALESQDPIRCFDFLGITIQYEMCYTNILQILELSGIPFHSRDRKEEDPIVVGGGPCTYNSEPIADFFDLIYIGEGEAQCRALFDAYLENKKNGGSRQDFLRRAARVPGIYVPSFYEPSYHADGTFSRMEKLWDKAPDRIRKEICRSLDEAPYPLKPVVPFVKAVQDRAVLEVQRGCIRGCRFCQAGMIYRPVRERSLEVLKEHAKAMLSFTGYDEISLSSLSTSDYTRISELVRWLVQEYRRKYINISLPSLRIDHFFLEMMEQVEDGKKGSLTFAPEAGSQRMRDVINKGITEEDILNGAGLAFAAGWNKVKLYFMLGLPGERDEDVLAIASLADRIAGTYFDTVPRENRKGIRVMINSSSSFFIPKPFTPFQWAGMNPPEEFLRKAYLVKEAMEKEPHHKSLKYQYHEHQMSELEGVFARGDRKLSRVILRAYKNGCLYDSWSEQFHYDRWVQAFEELQISRDFYTIRERGLEEAFPWDLIDVGASKEYLKKEYLAAKEGRVTPNCRDHCNACGAAVFGTGICFKNHGRQMPEGAGDKETGT
ncbi:MAG: TIGR03960 family B12-binding radical SAM protein [Lachnospiraceae bacterium]|nr:TIGR03960 family B12-binding radical SAM protein [Lachnospiraceae bacterium]